MILDGLDRELREAARPWHRRTRRRRQCGIGWPQVTAQMLHILATTAFVVSLLLYAQGDL